MSSQTPRAVKRTGLVLPPRRKLGLGGATLRWCFYVLLSLIALLCTLALLTDRLSLDKGHTPKSVTVSASSALVNSETLTKRLERLHLRQPDVDVWVMAQESESISDVRSTVMSQVKKERPGWLADEHLSPHKLVLFLNITDANGHADSGLYVGMDLNDGNIDENREVGDRDFANAQWVDGLVRIVDAQAGKDPSGALTTGILWAVGVASLVAIVVIALLARSRFAAAQEGLSAGKDAIAQLEALLPQVAAVIDEAGSEAAAEPPPLGTVAPAITMQRLRSALADVQPACTYWSTQLDGFTRSRMRSRGAVDQLGYAATNLQGLVDRAKGLADVARMAGGLPGWQDSALRQAELLERDANTGARVLDAPSVQATDRSAAVLCAVDEAHQAVRRVTESLGAAPGADSTPRLGHGEVLTLLERASSRLASEVARAGNAAAASTKKAEDVVPLLNASANASSAEADTPTVGRFTTVDAQVDPGQPAYPAALGFTEESPNRDVRPQGQRHPAAAGSVAATPEPLSEQTGELLNPFVVVPGASAFYLAVKEAGGLPKAKAEEHEAELDTEGVPKVQPSAEQADTPQADTGPIRPETPEPSGR
ncbi:MAG: DUF5129 domain-containing protein [Galactobacter sp.]